MEYYAHRKDDDNELLINHLLLVAKYAEKFGEEFGQGKVCRQLGLLHDVGKHTEKFQDVLFRRNGVSHVDHAIVAAKYFYDTDEHHNFVTSYLTSILASHHSDLCFSNVDYKKDDFVNEIQSTHKQNALRDIGEYEEIVKYIQDNKLDINLTEDDWFSISKEKRIEAMLYIRILFSCLVDADYTATAEYLDNDYFEKSEKMVLEPSVLLDRLDTYRDSLIKNSNQEIGINKLRSYVYNECTQAGRESKCDCYTLNAPTGTAKTLALIKFALECAKKNNQKRIFIVLPYLSIISQNAEVYRQAFGEDIVLEDSSSVEYTEETKLYSDRWSSPIIVTTSVKFFETLFKSKASEVRRLHQLSNAVIVFDECQTLPTNLIDCSMESLKILTRNYKSTVLLSTATLPTYEYRENLNLDSKEIIHDVNWLYSEYNNIKNTKVVADFEQKYNSEMLYEKFKNEKECLFIFNTVSKASDMYELLKREEGNESVYLITSNMCSKHKLDTIEEIKIRLKAGDKCYVASTQAVEIGVDFDFPIGCREYAPLDSVIQSAGRVNRNGSRTGSFFVFEHEDRTYPGTFYENSAMLTRALAEKNGGLDLNDPKLIAEYYKTLYTYDEGKQDSQKLQADIYQSKRTDREWFIKTSKDYYLIKDMLSVNVIVPYIKDKYDQLTEQIYTQGYITKKDMVECKEFCINLTLSKKNKEILEGCIPVSVMGEIDDNPKWYIAPYEMYGKEGLHKNNELTYVL